MIDKEQFNAYKRQAWITVRWCSPQVQPIIERTSKFGTTIVIGCVAMAFVGVLHHT